MTNAVSVAITIAIISRQVLFLLLLQKGYCCYFFVLCLVFTNAIAVSVAVATAIALAIATTGTIFATIYFATALLP